MTGPRSASEAARAYLAWLATERRASPLTVEAYGRDLAGFLGFLAGHLGAEPDLAALAGLRQADLRAWLAAGAAAGAVGGAGRVVWALRLARVAGAAAAAGAAGVSLVIIRGAGLLGAAGVAVKPTIPKVGTMASSTAGAATATAAADEDTAGPAAAAVSVAA